MPRKLPKTVWERLKYTKLKNLTMYYLLITALLPKKIQFEEENSKLDI